MRFDGHFIKGVLPNVSIMYDTFPQDSHFSVDSRTIQSGDIFVAVSGTKYDGHNFVQHALDNGAGGCIVAAGKKEILDTIDKKRLSNKCVLVVDDPLHALLQLAAAWRAQFDYPVVAVTGSVGKTTTKEMLANIARLHGIDFTVSIANQNTQLGVALNILNMRADHKLAIFEVGISKRGEMAQIAQLLKPTTAVITTIGHQHMDGLGSLQDIALEKRNIFKYFTEKSIGVINGDQPILSQVSYQHPVIKFGSKTTNQIQARKIRVGGSQVQFVLKIYKKKYNVVLHQPHMGIVFNAVAAAAVAQLLDVPNEIIVAGVQVPLRIAGRFEQRKLAYGTGTLINDCYNANPESMKSALLAMEHVETHAQKIVVLGDMLGLGVNSPFWHRQLGRFFRKIPSVRNVILVGNLVTWTKKTIPVGVKIHMVSTWQEALTLLHDMLDQESYVLVKGSHAVGLQYIVDELTGATPYTQTVDRYSYQQNV